MANSLREIDTTPEVGQSPESPPRRGPVRSVMIALILMGVLLAVGIVPRLSRHGALLAASQEVLKGVIRVDVISPHPVPQSDLTLPGGLLAIQEASINARTTGFVSRLTVDIGARVRRGQVLAEIESPEIDQQASQAQADSLKARAGTGQARADLSRLQATVGQSEAQVASAQAKLAQARASLATSLAQLAQSRHALEKINADWRSSYAQYQLGEKEWKRYQQLSKDGYVTQQDVDTKLAAYESSKAGASSSEAAVKAAESGVQAAEAVVTASTAQVTAAMADLSAAQQYVAATRASVSSGAAGVEVSQFNEQSSHANADRNAVLQSFEKVVAPFPGVITSRNVDVGTLVNASGASAIGTSDNTAPHTGLFGIARVDTLRILLSVPQSYIGATRTGRKAEITVAEMPGEVFEGKVFHTAGALDSATRSLMTEIRVNNATGRLLPGMYAQVRLQAPDGKPTLRVPGTAVVVGTAGVRVAILDANHKVHYQPVKLGRDFGAEVEVVDGLKGGENLINNPPEELSEGAFAEPIVREESPAK